MNINFYEADIFVLKHYIASFYNYYDIIFGEELSKDDLWVEAWGRELQTGNKNANNLI